MVYRLTLVMAGVNDRFLRVDATEPHADAVGESKSFVDHSCEVRQVFELDKRGSSQWVGDGALQLSLESLQF